MASFLSEAWLDEFAGALAGLPARPGVSGTVRIAVSKTPHGKVQFRLVVEDGSVELVPGRDGDQDATATWSYPDAVAWCRGELDPDAAFMAGRCKVEGDYTRYLFGLRPVLGSAEFAGALAGLAAVSTLDDA